MSLLSLESAILADSLLIDNTLAIHMFVLVFVSQKLVCFSINIDAFMFIHHTFTCSHDYWLIKIYTREYRIIVDMFILFAMHREHAGYRLFSR